MTGIKLLKNDAGVYDLDLSSGYMELGEVTPQNQAMLLQARPGDYHENPDVGVGLPDILYDHELSLWKRKIVEQLERDGQRIISLQLSTDKVTLNAEYKQ